jgi:hypothetical protein
MSYVVAASVLKYPVKEPTIRPTILSIIFYKKRRFARKGRTEDDVHDGHSDACSY